MKIDEVVRKANDRLQEIAYLTITEYNPAQIYVCRGEDKLYVGEVERCRHIDNNQFERFVNYVFKVLVEYYDNKAKGTVF